MSRGSRSSLDLKGHEATLTLNKVTRDNILRWMLDCGFEIALNHREPPSPEQLAQYESLKYLIQAPVPPDVLLDRWVLIVARKPF